MEDMKAREIYLALIFLFASSPCRGFRERTSRLPKCWTRYGGECVHVNEACPFVNGTDLGVTKNATLNSELCHTLNARRCCIPPAVKSKEKRYDNHCGIRQYNETDPFRIIGGVPSVLGEWPWHVVVRRWKKRSCGGTLIHPRWVLSAAHCFKRGYDVSVWDVVISEVDLVKVASVEQTKKVKRIINHSQFISTEYGDDIALLELESDIQLNSIANTACLPNVDEQFDDMICTVTGFGDTNGTVLDLSTILRQVNKPIVPNRICKLQLADKFTIFKEQICSGFNEGGRDSCAGDSGGPLVCRKRDSENRDRWILAGVVSYGYGCALSKRPGVYVRVSKYLDWIEFHTKLPFYDGSYVRDPNKKFVPRKLQPS